MAREVPKGYRFTRDKWHEFGRVAVYVDENGMITRATKKDRSGEVPAAVYRYDVKLGCWTNIMPCTPADYRKNGCVI